jgi:hypothetical protein
MVTTPGIFKSGVSKFLVINSGEAPEVKLRLRTLEDSRTFYPEFHIMLSTALLKNNLYLLSKEQQALFERYCIQAAALTDADLIELDNYLGSM